MSAAIDYSKASGEVKNMWGQFVQGQEFKTLHLEGGVEVGVVKGLLATWDIDEGNDRFHRGAFLESIEEHKQRNMRQIRISNEHSRDGLIGGAPIEMVRETEAGLEIVAHINLEHSDGKNIWALIRQGVLVDFSIGYTAVDWAIENEVREITKALIWHGSTVSEPMNRNAQIQAIKALQTKLPIAADDTGWDREAAWKRVQASKHSPALTCIGHKSVCDIIDGELKVIPQALRELVEAGVHDPEEVRIVERYYAAMKKASPFKRADRQFWTKADAETITAKELEGLLFSTDRLSRKTAKYLVSRMKGLDYPEDLPNDHGTDSMAEILKELRAMQEDR